MDGMGCHIKSRLSDLLSDFEIQLLFSNASVSSEDETGVTFWYYLNYYIFFLNTQKQILIFNLKTQCFFTFQPELTEKSERNENRM